MKFNWKTIFSTTTEKELEERKGYVIKIFGRIQNTWFRSKAKKRAGEFGVTGFVRYEGFDGIYIEVEGTQEALEVFADWCREGPPLARIDQFEIYEIEEEELSGFEDFTIL